MASEERFLNLRGVLEQVKEITVGALVANEELQADLVADAEKYGLKLLMRGFIGECMVIVKQSQQQPAASPEKGKRNISCTFSVAW